MGPAEAMEAALELEKTVNQSLLDLHKCADSKGDAHPCDFLEAEYLGEQVDGIKSIGDWIIKIKRAGDGLGLHLIDKEIGSYILSTPGILPNWHTIQFPAKFSS